MMTRIPVIMLSNYFIDRLCLFECSYKRRLFSGFQALTLDTDII